MNSVNIYKQIRTLSLDAKNKVMVIFDIDSTLYNVTPRNRLILKQFCNEYSSRPSYTGFIEQLFKVEIRDRDWGLRQAVVRAEVKGEPSQFEELRKFWKKHFFTNEFLHADMPYPRAALYVNEIFNLNVKSVYLTGRNDENMRVGTLESFASHGFPLPADSDLIMKPTKKDVLDEEFKAEWLRPFVKEYTHIFLFDNEPVILNRVHSLTPTVSLIWVDSTHSGKETPPETAVRITPDYEIG